MDILEKKIKLSDIDTLSLFGYNDTHLKLIENKFHSSINVRGDVLTLRGEPSEVKIIEKVFDELRYILLKKGKLQSEDVMEVLGIVRDALPSANKNGIQNSANGVVLQGKKDGIRIKNQHQQDYVDKVAKNDIVFAIGPAGTGKTFLAVAMALAALRNNEVSRILLSRPAVEAGESLGFLPGDLNEKVVPYLRPLLDALGDMLTPEKLKSMSEKEIIEIVPLAYMRGRTLNNSFIILDEAQNATITQMKMFLTRLGRGSKAIITGDITQIDLPNKHDSGLVDVQRILHGIDGIDFIYFDKADVVRHRLVADIIDAYEKDSV
ncbi:MAG: PhoH family protein [Ignavibacteria bacterium]|nr:PhoH family protein [Ignavibacteria bacterium]